MKVDEIPGISTEQIVELRRRRNSALHHSRVLVNLDAMHGKNVLVRVSRTEDLVRKMPAAELYERAAEVFQNNLPEGYRVYINALG